MSDTVNRTIHPDDEMMAFLKTKKKEDEYFLSGEQTLKIIISILKRIRPELFSNSKVLDYGCAHGRIVRHIPKFLNPSKLAAADVWDSGVKFCSNELGAIPFVISHDNPITKLGMKFHIITAISVFSHLPPDSFRFNLNELKNCLEPSGLILFTTNGEYYKNLNNLTLENGYRFGPIGPQPNHTNGRLSGEEYSFMCVLPSFVYEMAKQVGLKIYEFLPEGAFAKQDMYIAGF